MKESSISSFRGCAGESVANFVRPGTWLTLIPVLGCYLIVAVIAALLGSQGVAAVLGYLVGSYLLGRFALPAAQGELNQGFYAPMIGFSDIMRFMMRHFLALLAWELPIFILLYLLPGSYSAGLLSPFSLLGGGVSVLFMILLAILFFAGPGIAAIIAAGTEESAEVFQRAVWRGALIERAPDLTVFFAALLGGGIVFFVIYLIPAAALFMLIASQSWAAAVLSWPVLLMMPLAASPILLGRLAGAFCYGWDDMKAIGSRVEAVPNVLQDAKLPPSPAVKAASIIKEPDTIAAPPSELSQELVAQISSTLRIFPEVICAHLFERVSAGKTTLVVGLELDAEAKLAARQKVLSDSRKALGHGAARQIEIVTGETARQIEEVGLRVYQRR